MYLKRLEIKGFKSFADRVDLEFGKGITAIVGPNGSGKSNIYDCIKWVLGEQSAKTLRGSKMEDVIFAGTENRKGLGCAEVSLTIDNSNKILPYDYSEITVTRRLFKSGESEYLINNTQCRLKDITELFMDTGIGTDGYSLIGQGKIEEILSSKSEDRRMLFEEAAGIVKYKTRKLEAEKKLESTRLNLVRILDIINNLEEQIEPLKHQSIKAKKFLVLREELKELDINVLLHSYESSKNKLNDYLLDIQNLESSKNDLEIKKKEKLKLIESYKEKLYEIEKDFEIKNNERIALEKKYESLLGNLSLLDERKNNLIHEKERLIKEQEEEKGNAQNLNKEHELICIKRSEVNKEVLKIKSEIEMLEEEYNAINNKCNEYEALLERKKGDLLQVIKDISDINNKINSSAIMLDNLKNRKNQLNRDLELRNNKISELNIEVEKILKFIESYNNDLKIIKQEALDITNYIKLLESKEENLNKQSKICFENLKTYEAKYKTLLDMDKDMEGFNRAVKSIIKNYLDKSRVFGTVSDLIEVPKGYETAIEIALGATMQNIVVDNEDTSIMLIDYLKKNNIGRATFLPLSIIKGKEISDTKEWKNSLGFLGIASDIVKYDLKFKNIITNILGRVLVCDNLENAKSIARKTNYNYRIVTLEGDVVNVGGAFTGGSNTIKTTGVFARKNEIEELKNLVSQEKDRIKKISEEIYANSQEVIEKKNSLNSYNQKIVDISSKIQNENQRLEIINNEITNIKEIVKDIKIEIEQIDIENNKNTQNETYNKAVLDNYLNNQKSIEREIEDIQLNFKNMKEQKDVISKDLTAKKIIYAERQKTVELIESEIERLEKELKSIKQKIEYQANEIKSIDKRIISVENDLKKTKDDIDNIVVTIELFKKKFNDIEVSKKQLSELILVEEGYFSEIERDIMNIINSMHKIEISKSKLESEIEMYTKKIWDDYEISIAQAIQYKKSLKSIADANSRISQLKSEIKSLGEININAIEEYKRVTERYDFLTKQKEDLVKAENSLIDIINEIEKKMKEQFEEKFEIIRNNFNQTFKELFGGGFADLKLESNDILNCGIDIIVQPPGKKLQSLSLLSGGERGLAAIALLFAILRMKPTPFCVLDEIEAALDDANVSRFAKFLKDYSKKTQFIIITHRKGSMAAADMLYGVTMEEKGISKVISLKLKGGN
ncbi:chromosome segregation protein SMC [Caloramator sp. E03]|uniref:chromosome segregation protein SMC n=1 Tax=Caloramator sp. E03 TaxID=2576307 RepID=UPI00143CE2FA|nr:chromosome segregation protein SMC [Caloramator sp. E03]